MTIHPAPNGNSAMTNSRIEPEPIADANLIGLIAENVQSLLAGFGDLTDETLLSATTAFTFPSLPGHAYQLIDLALDNHGRIRCIECNGTNGAGSSISGRDVPRVEHEINVILARQVNLVGDVVLLVPESPDTRSTPEIRTRAVLRATMLSRRTGIPIAVTRVGATLRPGAVVVSGPIPQMVDHMTLEENGLMYDDRPVVFLNNINVIVELARRMSVSVEEAVNRVCVDRPDPIHDGWGLALLSLDKIEQQLVAGRTSLISPVFATPVSGTLDQIAHTALEIARKYGGAIIKPSATSGGSGVVVVDPSATPVTLSRELEKAAASLQTKYGDGWQQTCPFAIYEFIQFEPAMSPTGPRRWDIRMQVAATPEGTVVTPLSARLCPEPIGPVLDRATGVNNLTGRSTSEAGRLDVNGLVGMIGGDHTTLERFAAAAYEFTREALLGLTHRTNG